MSRIDLKSDLKEEPDLNRLVFSRFFYLRGNLGNVNEKPTRKTCFSRKKKRLTPRIYLAKFARRYFSDVNEISIVFSWEIDIKTGQSIWKRFNYKSFIKSIIKALEKDFVKGL